MKLRLLMSVSIAALLASSFVARADDLETYQSALSKLTATPEEARSAETRQDIQKLQTLVQQQIELKKNTDLAQQAEQQLPTLRQQYQAAQPAYDAQATEVAKALDRLDALNKMYSGQSSAQAKLTQAIKDQQAAENKIRTMSPSDPNYAAALKDMATKQYLAGVAADVVKDPNNGLAKLQSAKQDYNEAKARLDQLNAAKNDAGQKLKAATNTLNDARDAATLAKARIEQVAPTQQGGAMSLVNKAAADVKTDLAKVAAAKAAPPAAGGAAPLVGANAGAAGLINNGGSTLINNGGSTLISPNGGTIVAQGAGNLAGGNGIVAQGAGNVLSDNGLGIVAQGAGNIVAQGAGNIVAQGAGNLAGSNGIVAQGAGNIVAQGAGNLAGSNGIVAQGAGNIIGTNSGGIVAQGAGNLAGSNGIVAQGAGNLVTDNGSGIVAQGAGNIISTNSGGIVAQGAGNLMGSSGIHAYKLSSVDSPAIDVAAETQKTQADLSSRTADVQKATKDAADARAALAAAQSPYDAKAAEVATKLDQIDALNKMYSGSASASAKLTQAIRDQQAAEKKVQSMSPKDPSYAAALKDMATKQYLAGVAADVVKDPKNGLAKLQSAQQDYNEAKAQLDQLNKAKNDAAQKIQDAQARINTANAAIQADNATIVSLKAAAPSGPALAGGSTFSPVGGPQVGGLAPAGTAGLINNGGSTLISPNGGTLVGNSGGTIISNDGASRAGSNGGAIISTNSGGIVAQGAGNLAGGNGIVAQGAGNIVAQGAGNIVAQGAGNLAGNGAAPIISTNSGGIRAFKDVSPSESAQASTAPKAVAGGGFRQDTQITISSANDGPNARTNSGGAVVAPSVSVGPSTMPKGYDPNDWTTWPKADVASFMPPGKSVQQFKASAEQDLATYKKNLAALPAAGLTKSQQDQKAGMEAQIRSLEFQVDTANRALGLPNSATATTVATTTAPPPPAALAPAPAPVPVISASAIAATVTLSSDLATAQQRVNDRAQQMASANQQLQQWQAQRATTTDPEKLKGLDAAISGGKFQLDVMQQALDRENKNVADLQASAAKVASLPPAPAATPPAAPAAAPAQPAVPLKITTTEQKGLEQALRTIPGKLSAPEKKTFNSLSVLAQKAVSKGLTPAEGAELLSGIRALAHKHPKGIERYKLTNLANPRHEGGGRAGAPEHPVQTHAVVPAAHGPSPAATVPVHPAAIAKQMPEPAVVKPDALKPHEVHAHPAAPEHGHGAAPAHAVRPEPPKPVMAHQHPAVAPKPETAHHHAPVAHVPAQVRPVAAPPKPHVANVPKPVAAAVPPKPKAVVAPPKPAAPVMQPIRH